MNNKKIGIITPGGDASGMNACIRAVVRRASADGFEIFGIMNGYQGLIDGNLSKIGPRDVGGIIYHGGTILKSSRCTEIKTDDGLKKAVDVLKKHEIGWLVVLGGDGSFAAAEKISAYMSGELSVVCIPASIDNDVYGTDETIGFDTAIDTAVEAIDKIRDTATSFDRVFIIEVMGREHGFLALEVGLASGAEFVLIPEVKYDIGKICNELKNNQSKKKTSVIIVFAEGCGDPKEVAKQIYERTGIDVRISNLGYIQRGGNPSARSRNLASRFGSFAVDLILEGKKNSVVVLQKNEIKSLPIKEVVSGVEKIDTQTLELVEKLAV